ncbi:MULTISPECIES: ABC transporter ATP-binding protein [unclassified Corynebacterium]|uniref:ABC transporter ATP-binding protein n=2 Tax=Corynebacteriaceae TaxID=1653 RepID=UPI00351BD702
MQRVSVDKRREYDPLTPVESEDPMPTIPAARAVNLYKSYGEGSAQVVALNHVTVEFERGRFTAIMGPSGSGKSTLMHCMAGLDAPSSGETYIGETELSQLNDAALTNLRRDRLGFVFQSFNLVPTLSAAENITLPVGIAGQRVDEAWFTEVTERLGLKDRLRHQPSELSGGQQQRVAVARALVSRPDIIFGDEPTGNLDSNSSTEVLRILRAAVDELNQTVVIVTHDSAAAAYADRVIFLADGSIRDDITEPTTEKIMSIMAGIEGR